MCELLPGITRADDDFVAMGRMWIHFVKAIVLRSAGSSEKLLQYFRSSCNRMRGLQTRLLMRINHPALAEEVCPAVVVQAVVFEALVVATQSRDMVPQLHYLAHHLAAFDIGAQSIDHVAISCQMVWCRPICIVAILLFRSDK